MAIHIHPYSLVNGKPHEAPRHFIIKMYGFIFEKLGLFDGVNEHVRKNFARKSGSQTPSGRLTGDDGGYETNDSKEI